MFQALVKNFMRGLLIVVPAAVTVWIVYFVVVQIDGFVNVERLLNRRVPGAGVVLTLAVITLIGFLASNFLTRWFFHMLDDLFARLPLVKLLYTSLKDLIGAFVGDKKRFDKPVLVRLDDVTELTIPGFVTREGLAEFGIADHVAVYFPQSYNFAGNVLMAPRQRVRPLQVDSATMMAFIVSGGVAGDIKETHGP